MTDPRNRSTPLLITAAVCAIAISGLMLVVIVILADRNATTSATPKTTTRPPAVTAAAPVPLPVSAPTSMSVPTTTTEQPATALDRSAVATEIASVLQSDYGITDVTSIHCPSLMPVHLNAVYTCTLKVAGDDEKVSVRVTTETGTYEVSRPS